MMYWDYVCIYVCVCVWWRVKKKETERLDPCGCVRENGIWGGLMRERDESEDTLEGCADCEGVVYGLGWSSDGG
jgi:hypothetical protein